MRLAHAMIVNKVSGRRFWHNDRPRPKSGDHAELTFPDGEISVIHGDIAIGVALAWRRAAAKSTLPREKVAAIDVAPCGILRSND